MIPMSVEVMHFGFYLYGTVQSFARNKTLSETGGYLWERKLDR